MSLFYSPMRLFYSDWFYEKLPLDFDPKKEPKDEAEKLALRAICNATNDRRISVKSIVSDLTRAAEMGYTPAWYMLGWLYQYQPPIFVTDDPYFDSEGNRLRKYKKAEEYYKTAVEAGEKKRPLRFGYSLYFWKRRGRGLPRQKSFGGA